MTIRSSYEGKLVVEELKMIKLCGKLKNDMFNMWAECAFGCAAITIVRKLPRHRAKGSDRLILKSTFLLPSFSIGTAAVLSAAALRLKHLLMFAMSLSIESSKGSVMSHSIRVFLNLGC